jgi:hypothetical protein
MPQNETTMASLAEFVSSLAALEALSPTLVVAQLPPLLRRARWLEPHLALEPPPLVLAMRARLEEVRTRWCK